MTTCQRSPSASRYASRTSDLAVDARPAQAVEIALEDEPLELRQVVAGGLAPPNRTDDQRREIHAQRPAPDVLPIDRGSAAIRECEEVRAHEIVVEGRLWIGREACDALISRRDQRLRSPEPVIVDEFHDQGSASGVSKPAELRQRLLDAFGLPVALCPGVFRIEVVRQRPDGGPRVESGDMPRRDTEPFDRPLPGMLVTELLEPDLDVIRSLVRREERRSPESVHRVRRPQGRFGTPPVPVGPPEGPGPRVRLTMAVQSVRSPLSASATPPTRSTSRPARYGSYSTTSRDRILAARTRAPTSSRATLTGCTGRGPSLAFGSSRTSPS